jgi:hypothetical protein
VSLVDGLGGLRSQVSFGDEGHQDRHGVLPPVDREGPAKGVGKCLPKDYPNLSACQARIPDGEPKHGLRSGIQIQALGQWPQAGPTRTPRIDDPLCGLNEI